MKKINFKKTMCVGLLMIVGIATAQANEAVCTKDHTDIEVTRNQPNFVIQLKSNTGSTGFSWKSSYKQDMFEQTNYKPSKFEMSVPVAHRLEVWTVHQVGVPHKDQWTFHALSKAFFPGENQYKIVMTPVRASTGEEGEPVVCTVRVRA